MTEASPTRNCPVRGCTSKCGVNQVCCKTHWFQLPQARRDEIWRLYRSAPGSDPHRKAVMEALHWLSGSNSPPGLPPTPPQVVHWIENVLRKRLNDPKLIDEHFIVMWAGYQELVSKGKPPKEALNDSVKVLIASVVLEVAGIDPENGRDTSQERN